MEVTVPKWLTTLQERPAGVMNLVGGRLFLDFVNTVGARHDLPPHGTAVCDDKLKVYLDIVAWGLHVKLLSRTEAEVLLRESGRLPREASAVLRRAVRLREAIHHLCKAVLSNANPEHIDLDVLNHELHVARNVERLVGDKAVFSFEWNAPVSALDRVLWFVTRSAAEWLTTGDLSRLRECQGEDCGWVFEDTSRNRSRQWCDMSDCGNRAKIRRFRMRQGMV
jgi:predicted RNA-binding Zn ribbon-like protein